MVPPVQWLRCWCLIWLLGPCTQVHGQGCPRHQGEEGVAGTPGACSQVFCHPIRCIARTRLDRHAVTLMIRTTHTTYHHNTQHHTETETERHRDKDRERQRKKTETERETERDRERDRERETRQDNKREDETIKEKKLEDERGETRR